MKIDTINFEKEEGRPLYLQIFEKIRDDIINGYLKQGDKLPSLRSSTQLYKVSRTTIEACYQRLLLEGYIQSTPQVGYSVSVDRENAQMRKAMLEHTYTQVDTKVRYDLRTSAIDRNSFDYDIWMHYLKEVLRDRESIASYGEHQGEMELRQALHTYSYSMRGVLCNVEQILIGASVQSLLYIICGLVKGIKRVGMEASGFPQGEKVFTDCGFEVVKLPSDEHGICMEALQNEQLSLLYINSASYGKQHKAIPRETRKALLTWAKANNVLIIEDDHNGELRYLHKPTPAMQGYDMGKQVIYIGSFSKLLLPALRMSYMVLPQLLQNTYQQQKQFYNPTASKIEQLALARYIADGHLEKHIRRLRKRYEQKSKLMMEAITTYFPTTLQQLDESGLAIRLYVQGNHKQFVENARCRGIYLQLHKDGYIILSFASLQASQIKNVIQELTVIFTQS